MMPEGVEHSMARNVVVEVDCVTDSMMPEGVEHVEAKAGAATRVR